MGFPGAHNVRRRPQGLGVASDVSAPRIGDRAHCREHRTTRQNDDRRHRGRGAGTSGVLADGKHAWGRAA
jgi:hypothetical protein